MLIPGLVSITFRKLTPERIIDLCVQAGLRAIEWGGDVHAPHGDVARAGEVAARTRDAGLQVCAYGSYYRLGAAAGTGPDFAAVLASAVALGAPLIRVWAGTRNAEDADDAYRATVVADALRCAGLAAAAGVRIAYEHHGNTLTNTDAAAQRLLAETAHPAIRTFWQPHVGLAADACADGLRALLPRVESLHVFSWDVHARMPLAWRAADWRRWLAIVAGSGRDHACCLEFVQGDREEQLLEDAARLRGLLADAEATAAAAAAAR